MGWLRPLEEEPDPMKTNAAKALEHLQEAASLLEPVADVYHVLLETLVERENNNSATELHKSLVISALYAFDEAIRFAQDEALRKRG